MAVSSRVVVSVLSSVVSKPKDIFGSCEREREEETERCQEGDE